MCVHFIPEIDIVYYSTKAKIQKEDEEQQSDVEQEQEAVLTLQCYFNDIIKVNRTLTERHKIQHQSSGSECSCHISDTALL